MKQCLLIEMLITPEKMNSLSIAQWDLLVRQARTANLMGRLYVLLCETGILGHLPDNIQKHFISEKNYLDAQTSSVLWEIENIKKALRIIDTPVILLKGAAYLKSNLDVSKGRIFNDIDILVTQVSIENTEAALKQHGWLSTHLDEYDQKYYRKWMHEIPPLRHLRRKTVLDVHHNILPRTTKYTPDSAKLIEASVPLDDIGKLRALSDTDMFIHSATHLFFEGEFSYGLRDLVDLSLLSGHQVNSERYWENLLVRARELGLEWPVHYAIICLENTLKIQVPEGIQQKLKKNILSKIRRKFIFWLYSVMFESVHYSCKSVWTLTALRLLYIRGHWLKMPLVLLLPHLVRKAIKKDSTTEL